MSALDVDVVLNFACVRLHFNELAIDGQAVLLDQLCNCLSHGCTCLGSSEPDEGVDTIAVGTVLSVPDFDVLHQFTVFPWEGLLDGGLNLLEIGGSTTIGQIIEVDGVGRRKVDVTLHFENC